MAHGAWRMVLLCFATSFVKSNSEFRRSMLRVANEEADIIGSTKLEQLRNFSQKAKQILHVLMCNDRPCGRGTRDKVVRACIPYMHLKVRLRYP